MAVVTMEALGRVLADRGVDLGPEGFLSILAEAMESTDTLTGPEREFLVRHGGVASGSFDPARLAQARRRIALEASEADALAARGYSTGEVARLLSTATANVRRSLGRGDLYAPARGRGGEHLFPVWQFDSGRALPHLREVLAALPEDMHPLDVQTFMTTPHEDLRGRTPAVWLASGGSHEPVVALAGDLGRS